jgi:hypothetical protein
MKARNTIVLLPLLFCFAVTFSQTLNYSFEDVTVNPSDSTLSFSVLVSSSPSSIFHAGGDLYLNYNTAAFGTSLASQSANTPCGKGICVTATSAELTGNPYSLGVSNTSASIVDINWVNFSFFFPVPTAFQITGTPDTLAHVIMKYQDPSEPLSVSFNQSFSNGTVTYWDNHPATPASVGQYGSTYNYGSTIVIPATSLPVEFISFSADRLDSRNIQVRWETSSEVNNDHFMVQRSVDGEFFEEIGRVNGSGTTERPTTYSFLDNSYQANINYYRLKQVDYNGSFHFSNIVEVRFEGKEDYLAFHVYPSPVKTTLKVETLGKITDVYTVKIFDQMGRLMHETTLDKVKSLRQIDVSNWVEGIYNYEIIGGLEIKKTGRFLKL